VGAAIGAVEVGLDPGAARDLWARHGPRGQDSAVEPGAGGRAEGVV
jgi:hypothetical protein